MTTPSASYQPRIRSRTVANPNGRASTLPPEWARLADAAGGVGELAEAIGVSPQAVWKWGKGGNISRLGMAAVRAFCVKKRVPLPWAEKSDAGSK